MKRAGTMSYLYWTLKPAATAGNSIYPSQGARLC